jgi:hypothetical protein
MAYSVRRRCGREAKAERSGHRERALERKWKRLAAIRCRRRVTALSTDRCSSHSRDSFFPQSRRFFPAACSSPCFDRVHPVFHHLHWRSPALFRRYSTQADRFRVRDGSHVSNDGHQIVRALQRRGSAGRWPCGQRRKQNGRCDSGRIKGGVIRVDRPTLQST